METNKTFWTEFFELYKSLPPLWRLKDPDYSNREVKSECYEQLAQKLREIYPNADRELVVKKINTYRTSFRKEIRKLEDCKLLGRRHKPTLWYFNNLSFLLDQYEMNKELSTPNCKQEIETVEEKATPTQLKRNFSSQVDTKSTRNSRDKLQRNTAHYLNFEEEYLPEPPKKKPAIQTNAYAKEKPQPNHQAAADILAKSWAVQYREMQANQKLIARKLISDILFHGCLGILQMSHAFRIQDIFLNDSTPNHQYNMEAQTAISESSPQIEYLHQEEMDNKSLNSDG